MKGNFLQCTHNGTGGTGDLTLAAVDAFLTLGAPLGANIRQVYYKIVEYDGDPSTGRRNFVRSESGWCPLDNTGGSPVLKRSDGAIVVLSSNDGTNSYPRAGSSTAPSKQSFGNTAANIRISYSAGAEDNPLIVPVATATSGVTTGTGMGPFGAASQSAFAAATVPGNGISGYFPFVWGDFGQYTKISFAGTGLTLNTATSLNLYAAIYEVGKNGDPGKQLAYWNPVAANIVAAAVMTSSALGTSVFLDPGWYYLGLLLTWSGSLSLFNLQGLGSLSGGPLGAILKTTVAGYQFSTTGGSQTGLADPATAPTGIGNANILLPSFGLS